METTLIHDQEAKIAEAKLAIDRFIKAGIRPSIKSALTLSVIEEAVKDASSHGSLRGIPEGHLYVAVQGLLHLHEFRSIIAVLKAEKKVRVSNYLVTWIGKEN